MLYYYDMRALAISVIILVAVIMGFSAVTPVLFQQAEAHAAPPLPENLCDMLKQKGASLPPVIQHLISEHC